MFKRASNNMVTTCAVMMSFLHSQFAPEVFGPEKAQYFLGCLSETTIISAILGQFVWEVGRLMFDSCVSGRLQDRGW